MKQCMLYESLYVAIGSQVYTTINLVGNVNLHTIIFTMSLAAGLFTSRDWPKAAKCFNLKASCYPNDARDCDRNVLAGLKVIF